MNMINQNLNHHFIKGADLRKYIKVTKSVTFFVLYTLAYKLFFIFTKQYNKNNSIS